MNSKKTVIINGRFLTQNITGVQRYAHEILNWFDQFLADGTINHALYDIVVIAPKGQLLHHPKLQHIRIVQKGWFQGQLWEQLSFPWFCTKHLQLNLGNTAPILSLLFKKKTIVTLHDVGYLFYPDSYSKKFVLWYKFLVPFVTKFAGVVIAVSEAEKKRIVQKYGDSKNLIAIQNGGLNEAIASKYKPNRLSEKFILYAGSLNTKKNIQGAIAAFNILNTKYPEYRLVVVGASEKSFSEVHYNIDEKAKNNIIFAGRVSDEQLFNFYNTAACFVFPSYYEASPFPPLEAMALGCPVVSTNIDSLVERCGDAAVYCNPADPNDIANKIAEVISSPSKQLQMQNAGYAQIKKYNWEKCAKNTFEVIAKLA